MLIYQLLIKQPLFLLLAEVGILISVVLSIGLYQAFIKPLRFIYGGVEAIRDKDYSIKFLPVGSKEMDDMIAVYNNMMDNLRLERTKTEEQHFFLEKLIEASDTGILILDYDDQLISANPAAIKVLGESISNQHPIVQQMMPLKAGASLVLTTNGSQKYRCEVSQFIYKGFSQKFILLQDVSKELLAAEKTAYSKVIRMMAHEVNNSIGAINSILSSVIQFEELKGEWGDEVKSALQVAHQRNVRLNQFMRNFADVVRLPKPQLQRLNLNKVIEHTVQLIQNQLANQEIEIKMELPSPAVHVQADEQQMEQVLLNILKNAMEAIEQQGNIKIVLTQKPTTLNIWDNGCGITAEDQEKIFSTPFFSTKTEGQGVGLMLVREILLNHSARFSLRSFENGWTVFEMVFPS
ncbi:MAG: PAS domain-containing protein [Saprospiraceae bacterium]|nr:PAS domain-containing protein [Saprospiraceae bacterium]